MENQLLAPDVERYREYLESELGFRPDTVRAYLYYRSKLGGLENLNQEYVRHFIVNEWNNNKVVRGFMKNYLDFVEENIGHFPQVDIAQIRSIKLPRAKKQEKRLPVWITEEEMLRMEQKANSTRDKVMLNLSFYSGLRLKELCGLQPVDFNWTQWIADRNQMGKLRIRPETAKNGKERFVFVVSKVMNMIEDYIEECVQFGTLTSDTQKLFGIGPRRWQAIVHSLSNKALGRKISPHKLRHSFATMLVNKNMPIETIQKSLGHSSIATTQIYTHVSQQKVQSDFERIMQPQSEKDEWADDGY